MATLDTLLAQSLRLLPHHAISRFTHRVARWESSRMQPLLRLFIRHYALDMSEAQPSDPAAYPSFNALFTRPLRPEVRPLEGDERSIVSPADARVSAFGTIEAGQVFQAKGHSYTVTELFGGFGDLAEPFARGHYLTVYLSPRDYHRVHMPLSGRLTTMLHVPGRLFSVAPRIVANTPRLYARNERVVAFFETESGPMALALIGAINVGSIETVWAGEITPPAGRAIRRIDYSNQYIRLERGAEMGRFNLGSSVVVLLPDTPVRFDPVLTPDSEVRIRSEVARILGG
ncbi:Phosphatidylserine decarboxylase [Thioalkalivibrio nitratireducens DSM 14787]|uniref:Phosphatidylserine decarboxylase proenzyme n=1 Tax=Thioalkalivibrio nitratireducens (strain DSM 14787 / UNIQEM 213 / ALEN2) TaxID=1255043 RepID=L0E0N8_THIND|nr:archaetidylserine decarboxylase [Thioalkalivibrio nitratireducens]AGA34780.1 Phosphatidylserine decarboxylase [Thioalkalivibrio nitratireducens DSM 14787]